MPARAVDVQDALHIVQVGAFSVGVRSSETDLLGTEGDKSNPRVGFDDREQPADLREQGTARAVVHRALHDIVVADVGGDEHLPSFLGSEDALHVPGGRGLVPAVDVQIGRAW